MKLFINTIVHLFIFSIFVISAITHERAILRACRKSDNSTSAMWTAKIERRVIEE